MVDLDSNPTKLIEVVETGKQMLMTRGSLTTISIANDVAKYFAIIPAAFATTYPQLNALNVMAFGESLLGHSVGGNFQCTDHYLSDSPGAEGCQIPRARRGRLLRRNMLVYGLGGILVPFLGIKIIDLGLELVHLT